jgi:hypothetical protein
MMETDPTKRMEMLREELIAQGKEWENLNTFEQNAIVQATGMNKAQLALGLSSDKVRKSLLAKQRQQKSDAQINANWERGILKIKQVVANLDEAFKKILRSLGDLVSKFFGWESGMSATKDMGEFLEGILLKINKAIQNLTKDIDKGGVVNLKEGFKDFVEVLKDMKVVVSALAAPFKVVAAAAKVFTGAPGEAVAEALESATSTRDLGEALPTKVLQQSIKSKKFPGSNKELDAKELYQLHAIARTRSDFERDWSKIKTVEDAIVTKKGEVIQFSPNDNILATQSPIAQTPGGAMAGVGTAQPSAGGGYNGPEVIQVNLHLDGKKIAEQQVRLARAGT